MDERNGRKISTRNYNAPFAMSRFISKISIPSLNLQSCWEYQGYLLCGYGQFHIKHGRPVYAHRYNAEQLLGPLSPYLTVDHLCRNRKCVRPSHLELVTRRENLIRGKGFAGENNRKEKCPRGHFYNYVAPGSYGRRCLQCDNEIRRKRLGTTWRRGGDICKNGHSLLGDNLYICPDGKRGCKTCRNNARLKFMEKSHGK